MGGALHRSLSRASAGLLRQFREVCGVYNIEVTVDEKFDSLARLTGTGPFHVEEFDGNEWVAAPAAQPK